DLGESRALRWAICPGHGQPRLRFAQRARQRRGRGPRPSGRRAPLPSKDGRSKPSLFVLTNCGLLRAPKGEPVSIAVDVLKAERENLKELLRTIEAEQRKV